MLPTRTAQMHAPRDLPFTTAKLSTDVRSLTPASPVFRMTSRSRHHRAALRSHHHRNELPSRNALTIWRNDDVAIGAGGRGDVSGALPRNEFYFGVFEFSGEHCWQEALQACLGTDFRFQLCVDERQLSRRHACKRFEHGPGEEFEGHHGRDWISGRPKK